MAVVGTLRQREVGVNVTAVPAGTGEQNSETSPAHHFEPTRHKGGELGGAEFAFFFPDGMTTVISLEAGLS